MHTISQEVNSSWGAVQTLCCACMHSPRSLVSGLANGASCAVPDAPGTSSSLSTRLLLILLPGGLPPVH